jgi:ribonuclease HI
MNDIIIFTDGAVSNNQVKGNRKGGIGVFFGNDDIRNISISIFETTNFKVTNQVCELLACIKGIEKLISSQEIKNDFIIMTDSMYIVNSMNIWAIKWEKNNWKKSNNKTIENEELIKQLYNFSQNLKIKFYHVKAHTKQITDKNSIEYFNWYGNFMADKLATNAAKI